MRKAVHSEISADLTQSTAYAPDWRPRFAEAYRLQKRAWIASIATGKPVGASAWDGYWATLVAEAGVESLARGVAVPVLAVQKPKLY